MKGWTLFLERNSLEPRFWHNATEGMNHTSLPSFRGVHDELGRYQDGFEVSPMRSEARVVSVCGVMPFLIFEHWHQERIEHFNVS